MLEAVELGRDVGELIRPAEELCRTRPALTLSERRRDARGKLLLERAHGFQLVREGRRLRIQRRVRKSYETTLHDRIERPIHEDADSSAPCERKRRRCAAVTGVLLERRARLDQIHRELQDAEV